MERAETEIWTRKTSLCRVSKVDTRGYYAECIEIAFCEAGHSPRLATQDELAFLVTVLRNLSSQRPHRIH